MAGFRTPKNPSRPASDGGILKAIVHPAEEGGFGNLM
jgi:hypothetical protein